jgi:hypothetical protein
MASSLLTTDKRFDNAYPPTSVAPAMRFPPPRRSEFRCTGCVPARALLRVLILLTPAYFCFNFK